VEAEHLYLHVPFCAHRCGYCDFATVTGGEGLRRRYVEALLAEIRLRGRGLSGGPLTIFVGGGTPSLLDDDLLGRLLDALPACLELTVECNPETITPDKARVLVEGGVTRVSLGAQSFRPHLLSTLERLASPEAVRAAVAALRAAGCHNLNLDLMFGVPGQTEADLRADLDDALSLAPEHISYYELEAKPGTRFAHRHAAELAGQSVAMEDYYERVVETLRAHGYRWYETANFCRDDRVSHHNMGYWLGHDYLGVGMGAVSTHGLERRRNRPSLRGYLAALEAGSEPPAEIELLTRRERDTERLMLGLRLDRPLEVNGLADLVEPTALARLSENGLVKGGDGTLQLSDRGRFLANDVVASMLR
jgi:oxygen-independent coproporphyrinogen III oxidase